MSRAGTPRRRENRVIPSQASLFSVQNAAVYRELLERPTDSLYMVVLEHHSSIDLRAQAPELVRRQRLAAENWDAPFVVTTAVKREVTRAPGDLDAGTPPAGCLWSDNERTVDCRDHKTGPREVGGLVQNGHGDEWERLSCAMTPSCLPSEGASGKPGEPQARHSDAGS